MKQLTDQITNWSREEQRWELLLKVNQDQQAKLASSPSTSNTTKPAKNAGKSNKNRRTSSVGLKVGADDEAMQKLKQYVVELGTRLGSICTIH